MTRGIRGRARWMLRNSHQMVIQNRINEAETVAECQEWAVIINEKRPLDRDDIDAVSLLQTCAERASELREASLQE